MTIYMFFAVVLIFLYIATKNTKNSKIREQEVREDYTDVLNYVDSEKKLITKQMIERDYKLHYIPGIIQNILVTVFLIFVPIQLISWLLVGVSLIYTIININTYKTGLNQLSDDTFILRKETLLDVKVKTDGEIKEILIFENFKYTDYKNHMQPTVIGDEYYIIQVGKKKYVYNENYYDIDEELKYKINHY